MNCIGIPSEWNPFHAGHKSMIYSLKNKFPNAHLISAMSGSFVQRGEPAFFDKWNRSKWAVLNGIDIVIEFPTLCAMQSADYFAENQVLLLANMGCNSMAFGTESLCEKEICSLVSYIHTDTFKNNFQRELKNGLSYATAFSKSVKEYSEYLSKEITKANNILAFRYADAIYRYNLPIKIITINRDMTNPISATALRKKISSNSLTRADKNLISDEVFQCINEKNFISIERYNDMCLMKSRLFSVNELKASNLFTEGLEYRWYKNTLHQTYEEMLSNIKNKRYLYSRLKRIGASILFTKEGTHSPFSFHQKPLYARLLAANKEKTFLLNNAKLPIITKVSKALKELPQNAASMLEVDILATDLQSLCIKGIKFRKGKKDFFTSPFIK